MYRRESTGRAGGRYAVEPCRLAMPATAMFSNLKSRVGGGGGGATPHNILDHNPITQYFDVGKLVASAGPEHIWKIHDGFRKSDGKVITKLYLLSFFLFDK